MTTKTKDIWTNACNATWGTHPLHLCKKLKDHDGPCICACRETSIQEPT